MNIIYKQSSNKNIKNLTTFTTFVLGNTMLMYFKYLFSQLYEKLKIGLKI